MIKHHTVITQWAQYEYISNNDQVRIIYWPKPGLVAASEAYPACTSTSRAGGLEHYAEIKPHAV